MNKIKRLWGLLIKGSFIILLPILYTIYIIGLFRTQACFAESLAVILLVAMVLTLVSIIRYTPMPKIRMAIAPAFGFLIAYDKGEPAIQILFICFHFEISVK